MRESTDPGPLPPEVAIELASHLRLPAVPPFYTPQGTTSRSLVPPKGLYVLCGVMSAIVFWYSFTTAFVMSATGSLSLLVAQFTTLTRAEDGIRTGVGLLLLVLSGIALGFCVADMDFCARLRRVITNASPPTPESQRLPGLCKGDWRIPCLGTLAFFLCGTAYHLDGYVLHSINEMLSPPEDLSDSPWLVGMMLASAITVGWVWFAIPGTTALSNTMKESLLWCLGARRTDHHAVHGLFSFGGTIAVYVLLTSDDQGSVAFGRSLLLLTFLSLVCLISLVSVFLSREGRRQIARVMLFNWMRVQAGIYLAANEQGNESSGPALGAAWQHTVAEASQRKLIASSLFALLVAGAAALVVWP